MLYPFLAQTKQDAVESLKTLLVKPTTIAFPHTTGQNTVETDACGPKVRYVILQELEEGTAWPI